MEDLKFAYVTYIKASPEKIWEALTHGEFTKKFWFGYNIESSWIVGAPIIVSAAPKSGAEDVQGKILECDPPKRLVYSFHDGGVSGREKPSRLTFELRPMGPIVKLTVLHEDLSPEDIESNPNAFRGVNNGWPAILSSLKSLLETGSEISFMG